MKTLFSTIFYMASALLSLEIYAGTLKPENRIFLVDLSGSMCGLGSVQTENVLDKMTSELESTINWIPDSTDITIIPFTDQVITMVKGTSSDKRELCQVVSEFKSLEGNTNIWAAWEAGLSELDSTKINYIFLLSDGYHNRGISRADLYNIFKQWPESKTSRQFDCEAYFVLLDPSYRALPLPQIFDDCDKMQVVESMNVIRQNINTTDAVPNHQVDNTNIFPWMWLWILLIILLVALIIYLLIHFWPAISSLFTRIFTNAHRPTSKGKLNQPNNRSPRNNIDDTDDTDSDNDNKEHKDSKIETLVRIYQESESIHDGCLSLTQLCDALENLKRVNHDSYMKSLNIIPDNVKHDISQVQDLTICRNGHYGRYAPNKGGNWSGEKGNSYFKLDPEFPLNFPDGRPSITVKELIKLFKEDFGIQIPLSIRYKCGRVDLSCMSVASVQIRYEDSDLTELRGRGAGKGVQNIARPIFEEKYADLISKLGYSNYCEFKDGIGTDGKFNRNTPLVPHEDYDGQTIMLVPLLLHNQILKHYGGISLSEIVVKSTGRYIGPLI